MLTRLALSMLYKDDVLFVDFHFIWHSDVTFEENCRDFFAIGYKEYQTFKRLRCGIVRGLGIYFDMIVVCISVYDRLKFKSADAAVKALGNRAVCISDIAVDDLNG